MNLLSSKVPDAETFFNTPESLNLAKAIEKGDVKTIQRLGKKLDINKQYIRGMTFLNWAVATHQEFDSAKALLSLCADPHIETEEISPLSLAMTMDDIRWLKLLVEAGANINQKKGSWPLWWDTFYARNWDHLDYILEKGVDVNATDSTGSTAIISLAGLERYEKVLKLIEKGADVTVVTSSGLSFAYEVQESTVPKTSPEYKNRQKVIKILEEKGIAFPVPSPREIRDQQKQAGYKPD